MPAIPIAIVAAVGAEVVGTAIGAMALAEVGAEAVAGGILTEVGAAGVAEGVAGAAGAAAAEGAVAAGLGETLAGGLAGGLAEGVAGDAIGGGLLSSFGAEAAAAPMELMANAGADAATSGFASSIASPAGTFVGQSASSLTPLTDGLATAATNTSAMNSGLYSSINNGGILSNLADKGTGLLDWAEDNKLLVGMGANGLAKAYQTKVVNDESKRQFDEKMSRAVGGSMPSATWKNGA